MAALKFIISFLFVAIYLSPQVQSAALTNDVGPITRSDLVLGIIQPDDRLLYDRLVLVQAKPGEVVFEDVYFAGFGIRLNYISAFEIQGSVGASAVVFIGGLGDNNCGIRLSSAVGGELKYFINMYGH